VLKDARPAPDRILIDNTDARSRDYDKIKDRFRPGHADYTTSRNTACATTAAAGARRRARRDADRRGAIARRYLAARLGVRIYGYLSQVGSLMLEAVIRIRLPESVLLSGPRAHRRARGADLESAWCGRFDRRARHVWRAGAAGTG